MHSEFRKIFTDTSRNYYFLLIFLAVSLPLSVFTTSLAEILLALNWIAERNFSLKFRMLKQRKAALVVTLLFALHLMALTYSNDFHYAFHDLKIKLPILLIPILIGSSGPISEKQLRSILVWFSLAVLASSLISSAIFFGIFEYKDYDFRNISIFISHIRLSLMVNLAIYSLFFFGLGGGASPIQKRNLRYLLIGVALWLVCFLLILKSVTGIVIFIVLLLVMAWKYSSKIKPVAPRFTIRVLLITVPLVIASYLTHSVAKFYSRDELDISRLEAFTPEGNPYYNEPESQWAENGHWVWINVCEPELSREWNKRSSFDYYGKDKLGQDLRFTLIRYLTSKGLNKDAGGMSQLDEKDIRAVENGFSNYLFLNKFSLYPRVYQIIWELDNFSRGSDPSGHSVSQRLAYIKAATHIIKQNFIIGVGTGDVQQEFNRYYLSCDNPLKMESRRRAHNQFITFFLTFGIIGFSVSLIALFYPVFLEKRWGDYLFICFAIIAFLSMINEDTLETQTGVSFFMFFYALLLFGRNKIQQPPEPNLP